MKLPTKTEEELLKGYGKDIRECLFQNTMDDYRKELDRAKYRAVGYDRFVRLDDTCDHWLYRKCRCECHTPGSMMDHCVPCCDEGFVLV